MESEIKPYVTEWKEAPQMDTGAPMPQIQLLEDRNLLCAYIISQASSEEYAIVAFRGTTQFTFGYPNDEALGAHPLFKYGVSFYAFNKIENSPYLVELGKRNAKEFPGTEELMMEKQHYLASFHDETLEVVCDNLEFIGRVKAESGDDAINKIKAEQSSAGKVETKL